METYAKILLIAMPAFLLLVLLEKWYSVHKGMDTVKNLDMISSLTSGVTNVTKDVLGLSITILGYEWLVEHLAVYPIQTTWLTYVVAFIAIDFAGYWVHRISHRVNFFWNYHVIHHSSEEFNLACALRQSISNIFNVFSFLLMPAALLGVPVEVIATVGPLHLFAQFWYHTRHIQKMGWLENVIVTPSHHRVHHAVNPEYLDKNLGQIFIVWDKLFGTFQKELDTVPPVYGISRPAKTWNPIKINFQHLWLMIKDAVAANSWWDKLRIWFMPTGWRPADVAAKYPIYSIANMQFEKYTTEYDTKRLVYFWLQLIALLLLVSFFFFNIANLNLLQLYLYGLFIFLQVYTTTALMDRSKEAVFTSFIQLCFCISSILSLGDWFGSSAYHGFISVSIIFYYFFTFAATWYFSHTIKKGTISPTE
jgi:sterol desaturase/sphingolipid hydroxylase (fatty acid hydroxylase superfamily)